MKHTITLAVILLASAYLNAQTVVPGAPATPPAPPSNLVAETPSRFVQVPTRNTSEFYQMSDGLLAHRVQTLTHDLQVRCNQLQQEHFTLNQQINTLRERVNTGRSSVEDNQTLATLDKQQAEKLQKLQKLEAVKLQLITLTESHNARNEVILKARNQMQVGLQDNNPKKVQKWLAVLQQAENSSPDWRNKTIAALRTAPELE